MARKRNKETVCREYSACESREASLLAEIEKVKAKKKALADELEEIELAERRENNDRIGELVYRIFGDNISPDEFKEKLDAILTIDEVKEFAEADIKKEAC
ncbi:MAG: hypothetical protein J6K17_11565 [Oscillospiraceae bacterium]|nr:hypothetical protein [Oscillospiraceae bacterium]